MLHGLPWVYSYSHCYKMITRNSKGGGGQNLAVKSDRGPIPLFASVWTPQLVTRSQVLSATFQHRPPYGAPPVRVLQASMG